MSQESQEPRFEDALRELEAIAERLERGELSLEDALDDFERGVRLARQCARSLEAMELRVERLTVSEDGLISVEPFDASGAASKESESP